MIVKKKYLLLATLAGAIITLDQVVKMYVHTQFYLGETVLVIEDFFNITYVRNAGAAFGIFSESNETFRKIFFLSTPPLAIIVILSILWGVNDSDRLQTFALSSVLGGAIGNYIDRLRFDYVIDYLDFHFKHKYTWPAFNVADTCIVSGVILLVIIMAKQFLEERKIMKEGPASPENKPEEAKG